MDNITPTPVQGIHHITAIAGDPQRNVRFYTDVLGLRLIKQTVNFDDPETYHLYYGDTVGQPGTVLTFFPFQGAAQGRAGTGQASAFSFVVPTASLAYWAERLENYHITAAAGRRFDEDFLGFTDPDGLALEIVGSVDAGRQPGWTNGPVPAEHAIRGFHGVTLAVRDQGPTAAVLTDVLGMTRVAQEANRSRFKAADGQLAAHVEVLELPHTAEGTVAVGSVHHVAFRTPTDSQQVAWRERLVRHMLGVSPVMDRQYFHSIYFREPGGTLFEIATDGPGFAVDEPVETLGTRLMLPSWLETRRAYLQKTLPSLTSTPTGLRS